MQLRSFRIGLGLFAVLAFSLVVVGQTGQHRFVGTTQHVVAGNRVSLHHYHHARAGTGNLTSASQLTGNHRVGAAQGKKLVNFDLHMNNGRFALTANGRNNGIRNARVTTVRGQRQQKGRPHPNAGISRASVTNESMDGLQFISAADDAEFHLTQLGGGLVTITLMFQIGADATGNPVFARVAFQMSLQQLLALLNLQQPNNPPMPDPQPNDPDPQPVDPNM